MRQGTCKHYTGIGFDEQTTCKAGYIYLEIARPLTDEERAWHRENYPKSDEKRSALFRRLPCHAENGVSCAGYLEPTPEELAEQDRHTSKMISDVMTVRGQITDYIKGNNLPRGCSGKLPCPICQAGEVFWSRASLNLHIHARCTTPGCVQWME